MSGYARGCAKLLACLDSRSPVQSAPPRGSTWWRRTGASGGPDSGCRPGRSAATTAGRDRWPAVVAVVPARNEADSLPGTLPALLAQDYPGEFRVFLVDDGSDDGTGGVAAELGEKAARDGGAPLTVVPGRPRPDGWAGKVWAMSQGLAAATSATAQAAAPAADYVLFTDADIAWAPTALRDLVRGGGRRRPRPGLPDGPAPGGDGLGAGDRARVRVLLRPALSVQEGQQPEEPHLGRGRRLHADQRPRRWSGRAASSRCGAR